MAKVINLKSQEDITSVVERLWETGEEEVYLVTPKDSALLKNIIAMKLLKREADRLSKEIILITKDAVGREAAKRVGLVSKTVLPKKIAEDEEEVFKEVPAQSFETMIEDEVRAKREAPSAVRHFSDIRPKGATVERRSIEIEEKQEKITLPAHEEEAEETPSELEKMIQEGAGKDSLAQDFSFFDQKEKRESLKEEPEEVFDEQKEEETFPIHTMAGEPKWTLVKEKKPFFAHRPRFNFKKINEAFRANKIKPVKHRRFFILPIFSGKFLSIFIGAALVVFLSALYFILPKAEISVTSKTETVSRDLSVLADKSLTKIDFEQNKIPAQLIKVDKRESRDFVATGQRQVNDKAKGTITIYNEYSSTPQALVEKTRFISEDGKTFRLTKSITVPGAKIQEGKIVPSSIEAEVVADQPGSDYNIAVGRFMIPGFQGTPKYTAFYAQSKSAMSGGASGLLKVVTQEDYDKAKEEIWQTLKPAISGEIKSQLFEDLKIINGAAKEEISLTESSVAIGSPAEKFTMTLKGTATAVVFDEKDVLAAIEEELSDKLDDKKELVIQPEELSYQLSLIDFSRGQIGLKIKADGRIIWKIDINSLRREISGQDEKGIREIFTRHPEIDGAKVIFWPFWVKRAPNNLDKIIIEVR